MHKDREDSCNFRGVRTIKVYEAPAGKTGNPQETFSAVASYLKQAAKANLRGRIMTKLHWNPNCRIEDPRKHSFETVERLRELLADGSTIRQDPRRQSFYEVHDNASVYYIYASPISGKVYLLATWQKERLPVTV
jgi:hypothetical protein